MTLHLARDASGNFSGDLLDDTVPGTVIPSGAAALDTPDLVKQLSDPANRAALYWPVASGWPLVKPPPAPTPAQLVAAALAALNAYATRIYAAGVMFQPSGQSAPLAFPLDDAGRAVIDQAYLSATQSPSLWTDGTPIKDAAGAPVPMTGADVIALGKKASLYYQAAATHAASLIPQIEADPTTPITGGWPSNQ